MILTDWNQDVLLSRLFLEASDAFCRPYMDMEEEVEEPVFGSRPVFECFRDDSTVCTWDDYQLID